MGLQYKNYMWTPFFFHDRLSAGLSTLNSNQLLITSGLWVVFGAFIPVTVSGSQPTICGRMFRGMQKKKIQ